MWWLLLLACPAPSETDPVDSDCTPTVWHADLDADGFGSPVDTMEACTQPVGHVATGDDCDDLDAAVHPGAAETCDGTDQNCDGTADDGLSSFADADGDGFGDVAEVLTDCLAGVPDSTDCDDARSDVYPGADEVCDGIDQDCDGATDEDAVDAPWWYGDVDGDGWGTSVGIVQACEALVGAVTASGDCDDADSAISPGATEVCENGIDEDCDGPDDCRISGTWDASHASARIFGETELEGMAWAGGVGEIDGSRGVFVASDQHVWVFYEAPTTDVYVSGADGTLNVPAGGMWWSVDSAGTDLGTDGIEDLLLYDGPNKVLYVISADAPADVEANSEAWLLNTTDTPLKTDASPEDMDADGYADLWVGTPGATTTTPNAGAAYLLAGPLSGALPLRDATATISSAVESSFGEAIATADFDGDGLPELVVGAPRYAEGGADGAVFVFTEVSAGVDAADADAVIIGGGIYGEVGTDLNPAGDLDGDGVGDLLVGGQVSNYSVLVPGPLTAADIAAATHVVYWGMTEVDTADLDGDSAADLVLKAGGDAAYLYYGPVAGGTFSGGDGADAAVGGGLYPVECRSADDVDWDGYDDLLLVDTLDSTGARYAGATYLFLGSGL